MVCQPARHGVQQGAHHVIVAWLTYVGRTQTHGLGPEFVVCQPVGADDAEAGKLAMQTVTFVRSRGFQIQYQCFRAMPGDDGAYLLAGAGQMNRAEMLGKTSRQNLRNPGVILVDDYTEWFHDFPRNYTAIRGGLGCDSKLLAQALSIPSRDSVTYATLSRLGVPFN